jgi:hypothetical protein
MPDKQTQQGPNSELPLKDKIGFLERRNGVSFPWASNMPQRVWNYKQ